MCSRGWDQCPTTRPQSVSTCALLMGRQRPPGKRPELSKSVKVTRGEKLN